MAFKPLRDGILVRPDKTEEKTAGGIYLPDQAKERPMIGTVVEVGPGPKDKAGVRKEVGINAGERIVYAKMSGETIKVDDEELLLITRENVLGKVRSA